MVLYGADSTRSYRYERRDVVQGGRFVGDRHRARVVLDNECKSKERRMMGGDFVGWTWGRG